MVLFKSFKVPINKQLEQQFATAVKSLKLKLLAIDVDKMEVSPYTKKYFKDYQRKLQYSLEACAFILMHAIECSGKKIENTTIVDYGAGTGVLAMLAKEVGFGKVIYNDIYDISCKDANTLASAAQVQANEYVCGELNALIAYFEKSHSYCDIIVSRNVIEHIYNLDNYFSELKRIPNKGLALFFATTANIKNPLTVWYTQRIQRMLELKGMTTKWGKERDTLKPYFISRTEIIHSTFPQLNQNDVNRLAKATRGLMKDEIVLAANEFIKTSKMPELVVSGYNTCDPYTGNWAEHLVKTDIYQNLFEKNGFQFQIRNGFYNINYNKKVLNFITPLINRLIQILGKKGIYLAPFIGLKGKLSQN